MCGTTFGVPDGVWSETYTPRVTPSPLRSIRSLVSRLRRFVVADRSMEPTLVDGQGLVGWRTDRARIGQLRCVEHPDRPGFWLVKRVESVDGAVMRLTVAEPKTSWAVGR